MITVLTDYKNDKDSLIKDMAEREKIISDYKIYGKLNRYDAINKILNLRAKDKDIREITTAELAKSSTPFSISSDRQIVAELEWQKEILETKLSLL